MDLKTLLKNEGALVIDVREPYEFDEEHFEGAINIPLSSLLSRLSRLNEAQGNPIIFYCRSGNRSGVAASMAINQGFENVYNGGGLHDMQAAGNLVES